jgi:hypothetical protein
MESSPELVEHDWSIPSVASCIVVRQAAVQLDAQ